MNKITKQLSNKILKSAIIVIILFFTLVIIVNLLVPYLKTDTQYGLTKNNNDLSKVIDLSSSILRKSDIDVVLPNLAQEENINEEIGTFCKKWQKSTDLLILIANIRLKIYTGEPYDHDLLKFADFAKFNQSLHKYYFELKKYSESSVPTIAALKADFNAIESDLITAIKLIESHSALSYIFYKFFSGFIFIKKIGNAALEDGGIDMIIENVNNLLGQGELKEAILEITNIRSVEKIDVIQNWLKNAQTRLKIVEHIDDLYHDVKQFKYCEDHKKL